MKNKCGYVYIKLGEWMQTVHVKQIIKTLVGCIDDKTGYTTDRQKMHRIVKRKAN